MKNYSTYVLATLCVMLFICVTWLGVARIGDNIQRSLTIIQTTRPYRFEGKFMSEREALELGWNAMHLAGLYEPEWRARPDDRAIAPDGTKDLYTLRNGGDPNSVSLAFDRPDHPQDQIFFDLYHEGDVYQLSLSRGK